MHSKFFSVKFQPFCPRANDVKSDPCSTLASAALSAVLHSDIGPSCYETGDETVQWPRTYLHSIPYFYIQTTNCRYSKNRNKAEWDWMGLTCPIAQWPGISKMKAGQVDFAILCLIQYKLFTKDFGSNKFWIHWALILYTQCGGQLLNQFPLLVPFLQNSEWTKHCLLAINHIRIWQMSLQFSYGATCQKWMSTNSLNRYFSSSRNTVYGENNKLGFSNPNPGPRSHL